ncbi:MAG: hypothetical protein OHK0023_14720 [Anaerolineae bacterium]
MNDLAIIRQLYAFVADHYERDISVANNQLAADLAHWLASCWGAYQQGLLHDAFDLAPRNPLAHPVEAVALDIGAGTGLLARKLATYYSTTLAIDLAPEMLYAAHGGRFGSRIGFLCADTHLLPIASAACDVIAASFGLNHTLPKRSLKELLRVLRPHGLLVYQEWGAQDNLSAALSEVLNKYTDSIAEVAFGEAMAAYFDAPRPWYDQLQDAEDHYLMLRELGYRLVWAKEAVFTGVSFPSIQAFMRYKMAWASRKIPFEILAEDQQAACLDEAHAALVPFAEADGSLIWHPPLIRVCAVK